MKMLLIDENIASTVQYVLLFVRELTVIIVFCVIQLLKDDIMLDMNLNDLQYVIY